MGILRSCLFRFSVSDIILTSKFLKTIAPNLRFLYLTELKGDRDEVKDLRSAVHR